jgi:hypothetical protein
MHDIEECPICKTKNEVELWENGKCINCGNKFWWEDNWEEDGANDIICFEWKNIR